MWKTLWGGDGVSSGESNEGGWIQEVAYSSMRLVWFNDFFNQGMWYDQFKAVYMRSGCFCFDGKEDVINEMGLNLCVLQVKYSH